MQFHPSYDYTDFVEGLRPINNGESTIGFERRDGLFKRFCIDAIENYEDSTKSKMELSWKKRLQDFIDDARDQNKEFTLLNGAKFTIQDYQRRTIIVNNEQNEKTTHISVNGDDILELLSEKIELNNVRIFVIISIANLVHRLIHTHLFWPKKSEKPLSLNINQYHQKKMKIRK